MWLSGQHKQPADGGSGTGRVTIGGERPAVLLDCERRGLDIFSPGGFRWTPRVGQRVLVIQCEGEDPCVAGAAPSEEPPEQVTLGADAIHLRGQVYINGITLEEYVARIAGAMGG